MLCYEEVTLIADENQQTRMNATYRPIYAEENITHLIDMLRSENMPI